MKLSAENVYIVNSFSEAIAAAKNILGSSI
jgi:hypothetical protein